MADEIDRQQAKVSAITGAVVLAFALACYGLVRFFACYTPEPTQVLPAPGERSVLVEAAR